MYVSEIIAVGIMMRVLLCFATLICLSVQQDLFSCFGNAIQTGMSLPEEIRSASEVAEVSTKLEVSKS